MVGRLLGAIPVALFTIAGLRVTPESRSAGDNCLDSPGALFCTVAIFALVYAIIEGHAEGWGSPIIVAAFVVAGASAAAFVIAERVAPNPMVPLRFFKPRDFNGSVIVLFPVFFALMSMMFFLAQYFQLVQGKSAFRSGLYLMPSAIGMTFDRRLHDPSRRTQSAADAVGPRRYGGAHLVESP